MAGHRASGGHSVGHSSGGHRVSAGSFRSSSGSSYRSSSSRSSSGGSFGGFSNRRQSGGGFNGSFWGPGMYMLGRKSAHRDMERGGYYGGYGTGGYGYGGYGNGGYSDGPMYKNQQNRQLSPEEMQRQRRAAEMRHADEQRQRQQNNTQPVQPAGNKNGGCGKAVLIVLIIVLALALLSTFIHPGGSTVNREKLTGVPSYDKDCVADQIEAFSNAGSVESGLKDFYDQTGIQPYVIFKEYDASLTSDAAKEAWAKDFYDAKIDRENGFLLVYFAESPDYGDGYMSYVSGTQTNAIMDDEAVELFWGRIDKAWSDYGTGSFDSSFVKAYSDTAETIMRISTTGNDVLRWLLILMLSTVILIWIFRMRAEKNRREKERAEETERILKTPVEKFGEDGDELIDKYRDKTAEEVAAEKAAAEKAAAAKEAEAKAAAAEAATDAKIKAEMEAAEKAVAAEIAAEKAAKARADADAARRAKMGMEDVSDAAKEAPDPNAPDLRTFAETEADDLIAKYKDPQ